MKVLYVEMHHSRIESGQLGRSESQHETLHGVGVELLQEAAGDWCARSHQRNVLQVKTERAVLRSVRKNNLVEKGDLQS